MRIVPRAKVDIPIDIESEWVWGGGPQDLVMYKRVVGIMSRREADSRRPSAPV